MIALCVLLMVAGAMCGVSQPAPNLGVTTRDGRQAEIRFISQLSFPGANFNVSGQAYTGQSPTVTVKIGANPTAVFTATISPGVGTFQKIDTGLSGQATVSLSFPLAVPVTVTCPSVSKNDRVTYVLKQLINTAPTPINSAGTCSVGSAACFLQTGTNAGTITLSCEIAGGAPETLQKTRDCANVPVRFYNLNTGCETQIESAEDSTTKTFLKTTVPTTFGASQVDFPRNPTAPFQIGDVSLFAVGTTARFIDAFISSTGVLTPDTAPFTTAFLNIVNLAYRQAAGAKDNAFTVVVSQSSSLTSLSDVVHFQQSVQPGTAAGWIEVPVTAAGTTYFVHVFDDNESKITIFGNNELAIPTAATATVLVTGSQAFAANDARVFRIVNGADTSTLVVNAVPLNTQAVPLDHTRFVLWNSITNKQAKLAKPDSSCCNFLRDNDAAASETFEHNQVGNLNTLSPAPRNAGAETITSFNVFSGAATCSNLGTPIVPAAVTITDTTSSAQCADEGVFLFGREVDVFSQVCSSSSTGVSTCSAGTSSNVTTKVIVSIFGAPTDTNPANTVAVNINLPLCNCRAVVATPTPCPDLTCQDQKQVDLLTAAIAAGTSTVSGQITSQIAPVSSNVRDTLRLVKNVGKDVDDLADDIGDLADDIEDLANDVQDL